jgi:hypothetical protein
MIMAPHEVSHETATTGDKMARQPEDPTPLNAGHSIAEWYGMVFRKLTPYEQVAIANGNTAEARYASGLPVHNIVSDCRPSE